MPRPIHPRTIVVPGTIVVLMLVAMSSAGPLDPPAGPITSTYKTLSEVEPRIAINATNTPGGAASLFKITQPGSYYLTGNTTGVPGKHGIEIAAGCVTIDLMGFELAGVPGSLDGIAATVVGTANVEVRNGCVTNWGLDGIDLDSADATNCIIADVRARNNGARGIGTGNASSVNRCVAAGNAGAGISTGRGFTITDCSALQNAGTGIQCESGGTVTNCSVNNNGGNGIGVITGCTVTNCSAVNSGGAGIATYGGGGGDTILHCSAELNTIAGISVSSGSTVADCNAASNTGDGILCDSGCVIRANTCADNGRSSDGAGIHATGARNRIDGNNCTTADRGIDVAGAGNFITRNTCSFNTSNWSVAAGNIILVVNATTAGIVTGNSGGAAPGSTDPNCNFSY